MNKKLSSQLQDAYMSGDTATIAQLLKKIEDKAQSLQKKVSVEPLAVNTILNEDRSSAIKVHDFLRVAFGDDWWELEFPTIERLLWVNYGTALEDSARDKMLALKHLCNSQRPFLDWWEFNQVAVAFAGSIADFEVLRTPTLGMAINAVDVMRAIRPEEPFSREVKKYISILFINEGLYVPPPSIAELIQEEFKPLLTNFDTDLWPEIYNKYKQTIETRTYDLDESMVDIQVKRLLIAEAASSEYAK